MSFVHTQYTSENVQDTYNLIKSRKDDIPFNFAKRDMYDSTDIDFDANDYIGSHTTKVPKWKFTNLNFKIYSSKPIEVMISRQDGRCFAENESLDIYAIGASEEEAIDDFCQNLIYFYKHYKALSWDQVTGRAEELKQLFDDVFQETLL